MYVCIRACMCVYGNEFMYVNMDGFVCMCVNVD